MQTLAALVMLFAGTTCFAQADYALEKRWADERADVLKTLKGSAQMQLAGANHDYHVREADALKAIRAFFDQKFR